MRQILVFGSKTFKITVPDYAQLTFGPFSPPPARGSKGFQSEGYGPSDKAGTLRVYGKTKQDILAVFSQVNGFRDLTLGYAEEVAKEEGAVIWKDDEKGYLREDKVSRQKQWVEERPLLDGEVKGKKKRG